MIPPFVSKFAYSASFRTDELPRIETMQDVVELFPEPGTARHPSEPRRSSVVNGFRAHEVMHYIGKLEAWTRCRPRSRYGLPDFVVKVALSHWYLLEIEDDYPLVTEFAFDFDADGTGCWRQRPVGEVPVYGRGQRQPAVPRCAEPGRLAVSVWLDEDELPVRGVGAAPRRR